MDDPLGKVIQSNLSPQVKQINEKARSLSWNIATSPSLYRQLAVNPYSIKATELWQEKFPGSDVADIILAVILAEPVGEYDKDFKQLTIGEQQVALREEISQETEKSLVLNEFVSQNAADLALLSPAVIYEKLAEFIFANTNLEEIEQAFSRRQRTAFKLLISQHIEEIEQAKLIQDIPKLTRLGIPAEKSAKTSIWSKAFLSKRTLLIIACASPSLIFMTFLAVGFLGKKPVQVQIPSQVQGIETQAQVKPRHLPLRLQIPSLKIDSEVEYMGVDENGVMEVPENTSNVGWYELGPSPGEIGNAVITGHYDGQKKTLGVFNKLSKLKAGDKMFVFNDLGSVSTFVVRETRMYKPGFADEVFISNDGGVHLNLVTCKGKWDTTQKTYSERLVVFADLLENS